MRAFICLMSLLCGCSNSAVRCDAHLLPINRSAASVPVANAKAAAAAVKAAGARSAP